MEELSAISCQQGGQHSFHFGHVVCQAFVLVRPEKAEIASEDQVAFEFAGGTHSNIKEAGKLRLAAPPASFRNVRGDRSRCGGRSDSAGRFTETARYLIITAYEVTDE